MGKQLSIYLDETEARRLTEIAIKECRRPIDQARYILRSALMNEPIAENNKSVVNSEKNSHNAFATGQP